MHGSSSLGHPGKYNNLSVSCVTPFPELGRMTMRMTKVVVVLKLVHTCLLFLKRTGPAHSFFFHSLALACRADCSCLGVYRREKGKTMCGNHGGT